MKPNWYRIWVSVLVVLAFMAGGMVGALVYRQALAMPLSGAPSQARADLNVGLISQAWDAIQKHYVVPAAAQPQDMTYGAIRGMVDALGDTGHSTFLPPSVRAQQQNLIQGHFEGIGVEVEAKNGQIVIVAPLDDSPAKKAGVKPGDVIVKIDGQDVGGKSVADVVPMVLGRAGTQVKLTLLDSKQGGTRDVSITRQRIDIKNLTWTFIPNTKIAHVRLSTFGQGVGHELRQAQDSLQKAGATGIVLDMRSNPGGLLDEAVEVTSRFLKNGNVVLTKDAKGQVTPVPVEKGLLATDLPTVGLINAGSASASEIVAGALQDAGRAKLVGETTFGTGTVLNEYGLSDGSALLLATELWLTPKGRVIWHHGIEPDIKLKLADGVQALTPDQEKGMTADQVRESGDVQLAKALELLSQSAGK